MGDRKTNCRVKRELAASFGFRIAECTCKNVHLHAMSSGVTLRFSADQFRELTQAVLDATQALDEASEHGPNRDTLIN